MEASNCLEAGPSGSLSDRAFATAFEGEKPKLLWTRNSVANDDAEGTIVYVCLWEQLLGGLTPVPCDQTFAEVDQLESHLDQHLMQLSESPQQPGHPYTCHVRGCGILVQELEELFRHLKMHVFHASKQFYGFHVVNSRFPEIKNCNFPNSSRIVYQGDALICEWNNCMMSFVDINEYVVHLDDHFEQLTALNDRDEFGYYACRWGWGSSASDTGNSMQCLFKTKKRAFIRLHIQHHSGDKMCACPFCGAFFANHQKILEHVTRRQEGDPELACSYCKKTFKTQSLLNTHCKRHVRSHKCDFCSIWTDNKSELRRHVAAVHAKIKNHACEHCGRMFFQRADLNRHMELHFEEPSFPCKLCDKKFRWEKQLRHHVKSHDKNYIPSPYTCHLCTLRYQRGSNLSKHFHYAHNLEIPMGFSRYQYKKCSDGLFRLQTRRLLSKSLAREQSLEDGLAQEIDAGEPGTSTIGAN